jgi:phage-related minor tail protein
MNDDDIVINVSANTADFISALRGAGREADAFSGRITRAFKDAVVGGKNFGGVLSGLALQIANIALDRALSPLSHAIGGGIDTLFKAFGLAKGGVVGGGAVKPFASGGVVNAPTLFPLAHGLGLMGEAGAEAVMPLARGSDGRLGVRTEGGAAVTVNFHIATNDAESFRKSEAQVTAMLARAVGRGRRGL